LAHKISASNPFAKTAKKQLRLTHGPVASAEYLIFVTKTAKTATATARSTAEQQGEEKEGEENEIDCGKFFQLHYCSTTVPLLFHYCSTTVPLLAATVYMTWRAKKHDLATKQGEVIFDEPTFFSGTHAPPLSPLFGAVWASIV
jgi:hypothetical protein